MDWFDRINYRIVLVYDTDQPLNLTTYEDFVNNEFSNFQ